MMVLPLMAALAAMISMGPSKIEAATLTPGARPLPDGTITYPAPEDDQT
jgi:hypothetical protein